jgi:hypothetical protein
MKDMRIKAGHWWWSDADRKASVQYNSCIFYVSVIKASSLLTSDSQLLIINDKVAYKGMINCTNVVELLNMGEYLYKAICKR